MHEIKRIIESEGLRNLLAHSEQGYFADVIRRVDDALSEGGGAPSSSGFGHSWIQES